jgi:flagellar biosynthesis/type III secretory pathway protein FliH
MAKLIKKGDVDENTAITSAANRSEPRHGAIIDRDTFEARSEAQAIRDRATAQAEETLAAARTEAEGVLAQAHTDAAQLREAAHEEGLAQGKAEGVAQLNEATLRASVRLQEIEKQLAPQLTTLAVGIARRILGRELEFHPEAVVEVVKQALGEKARQRREITLRVHPDDAHVLRENKPAIVEMLSRCKEIAIHEDPSVQPHGVIVETEAGTIDAQLDTQLAAFERVLGAIDG